MLNMALCFNKMGKHNIAISEFTEVLTLDPRSLKAYSSRRQAFVAQGESDKGVKDLHRAAKLSPGDETVAGELASAIKYMEEKGMAVPVCPEFDHPEAPSVASGSGSGIPGMPNMTPEVTAQMEQMMNDPNAMEQMSSMLGNMSDEQLEQIAGANPLMAGMNPEHFKKAAGFMQKDLYVIFLLQLQRQSQVSFFLLKKLILLLVYSIHSMLSVLYPFIISI